MRLTARTARRAAVGLGLGEGAFLLFFSPLPARTGVIWVEKRDQMRPVAETAHCCGVEMVSGGRLKAERERGGGERIECDMKREGRVGGERAAPTHTPPPSLLPPSSLEVRDIGGRDAPLEGGGLRAG